ncbi:MAG: NAD(P)H-hydrate dehydratase [Prevotellaceae bacterium]|jgi:NAD(P)H-hydrate epimerase|nr:NAD(P)H-hydrate dehydratase [Prevotellaceae bacterium]
MKLFTSDQIRQADLYTIAHEPVAPLALMERAALVLSEWVMRHYRANIPIFFVVGKGDNGGDGLAMARLLSGVGYRCRVWMALGREELSKACHTNLKALPVAVEQVNTLDVPPNAVVIDALFGSGLRGTLRAKAASVVEAINALPNRIIAIDLPSGLACDFNECGKTIVHAQTTLCIQFPKLGELLPDYGDCCGKLEILPIGLHPCYLEQTPTTYFYTDEAEILSRVTPRQTFAHKNTYGHALVIGGSQGMIGAALLAAEGALRSGCGLVTLHIPASERMAASMRCPSALLSIDNEDAFSELPRQLERYAAIGIGCGLGQEAKTLKALKQLLAVAKCPMALDADALKLLAQNKSAQHLIPPGSILTPHVGELRQLIGNWENEEQKITMIRDLAKQLRSVIVNKGAHTMVCMPDGRCWFNATGNAGMAKGGSGDVLTGLLTGLLARGYSSEDAALIGVYQHGVAGDKAAKQLGEESMHSADLIRFL